MNERMCQCRWRWATGVAFVGILAFSVNVSAFQQTAPQILQLDGTPAPPDKSVQAIPAGTPRVTLFSVQSPPGSVATGGANGAEAVIYANENFSGFGVFRNYNPTTGLAFPGTMMADNLGFGGGFAGGPLSSYDLTIFRSSLDPQPGLADLHVELWDGDPFCSVDTPGAGFSCLPIAGSEADFVGIPAAFLATLVAVLPSKPVAPNTAAWMTLSTSETVDPGPCRLGWIISSVLPTIGNDQGFDVWEDQRDSDSDGAGGNGGICCVDGLACGGVDPVCAFCGTTGVRCTDDPDCPPGDTCFGGATDGNRRFCSDDNAEDANFFFFGGPCTGDPVTDFCATFMASVFAPADISVTLQPVGNGPLGALDPGASIVGNELIMQKGGTTAILEVRVSDFDIIDVFCVGGTNDGAACTSDADCPDVKQCNLASTNAGNPCASNADCPGPAGSACEITDPGSCGNKLSAYQSKILSAGFTSGLEGTLSRIVVACATDADCVAALGGVCSLDPSTACTVDADCPPIGPFSQTCTNGGSEGAKCDGASGQCIPGFITEARPDYIMAAASGTLAAVDVSVPQFTRIAAAASGAAVDELDPFPAGGAYAGSLALDVSSNARGTFTIDIAGRPDSALVNHRNLFIPLVGFVPGKVTVQTGQCCDATLVCTTDTVTRNQCNALGGSFDPTKTCADPCACASDADCHERPVDDACTTDVCDLATGQCSNTPVDCNDGLTCTVDSCDDLTGTNTGCVNAPLDCNDGLGCTTDTCVEPGGCVNTPLNCDDGDVCTVDSCTEPNNFCDNVNINDPTTCNFACGTVADCPVGSTACNNGCCLCSPCPDLSLAVVGSTSPICSSVGDKVVVKAEKGASGPVSGAQFGIQYDPSCLSFNSISPGGGGSPFILELDRLVDQARGRIFYAVGVNPFGGGGTVTGPAATLATLSFTKIGDCNSCNVQWIGLPNPRDTIVVDGDGQGCIPTLINSDAIIAQDTLTMTVPSPDPVNANCDSVTAFVTWNPPTASSSCAGPLAVNCTGTHPGKDGIPGTADDLDLSALAMGGGEFPIGVSDFWCTADSAQCPGGKSITKHWTVTVNDATTLDLTVQLQPQMAGNVNRCIKFELFNDCVNAPQIIERDLHFGGPFDFVGHFTDTVKVPTGQFACITARDQQHSLRSCDFPVCANGVFSAVFKGDPFFGGNWLTQGNLDGWKKQTQACVGGPNDGDPCTKAFDCAAPGTCEASGLASVDVIDILDFGQFVAAFGNQPSADTPCGFQGRHADINGDGVVDARDFTFVMMNFLASSKQCCCGPLTASPAGAGRDSITVREARDAGLPELAAADLDGNGVIDMNDMQKFMQGVRPDKKTRVRDRKGVGLRSR